MTHRFIVGLGNPGSEYNNTPHNAGFQAVDALAYKHNAIQWNDESKFHALIAEARTQDEKLFFIKPQTYMNESGRSIKAFLDWHDAPLQELLVIHDDIDLALGDLKWKSEGSPRGHKGVKSIIEHLGTDTFDRIRIGVGIIPRPEHFDAKDYVLKTFSESDQDILTSTIEKLPEFIEEHTK